MNPIKKVPTAHQNHVLEYEKVVALAASAVQELIEGEINPFIEELLVTIHELEGRVRALEQGGSRYVQ